MSYEQRIQNAVGQYDDFEVEIQDVTAIAAKADTALAAKDAQIAALTAERDRWIRLASDAHDLLDLAEPGQPATQALNEAFDRIDPSTLHAALRPDNSQHEDSGSHQGREG